MNVWDLNHTLSWCGAVDTISSHFPLEVRQRKTNWDQSLLTEDIWLQPGGVHILKKWGMNCLYWLELAVIYFVRVTSH